MEEKRKEKEREGGEGKGKARGVEGKRGGEVRRKGEGPSPCRKNSGAATAYSRPPPALAKEICMTRDLFAIADLPVNSV